MRAMIGYLREVVTSNQMAESLHAIFLDGNRRYLADAGVGQGDVSSLSLRMRELYGKALAVGATGIILAHNHPSGICHPSRADIEETRRLAAIGKALDIELLDHLIITQDSAYSMRAGGDL
ncbi:MAG: JAB domain-containing protein [Pseudomonadota bacterium]